MQPRTEELLYFLLWTADTLMRPTFRRLTESYEAWAYREGLLRQVSSLEKQQFLERDLRVPHDRVYRLSEEGRLHALGGRDPEQQWSRGWDGLWRLVLFDIPCRHNVRRGKLRRYLRSRGFGCLQGSVWITPDGLEQEREMFAGSHPDARSLVCLESRPCGGESDAEIVTSAWDFDAINRRYRDHLEVLERFPDHGALDARSARLLRDWGGAERETWRRAVSGDPLLPEPLLPVEYLGREAWERRQRVLARAGGRISGFTWPQTVQPFAPGGAKGCTED